MEYSFVDYQGELNKDFSKDFFSKFLSSHLNTEISRVYPNPVHSQLIVSEFFNPEFLQISDNSNNTTILCNNKAESYLFYCSSLLNDKPITVINKKFSLMDNKNLTNKFDLVSINFNISFNNFLDYIKDIIGYIKADGYLIIIYPYIWFNRNNLLNCELSLIEYAKSNDKRWLFCESITEYIDNNEYTIVKNELITDVYSNYSLLNVSHICSLEKLKKTILGNDTNLINSINLPSEFTLQSGLLVIKKNKKTITVDNLFNV